jgi:hypothetical protein
MARKSTKKLTLVSNADEFVSGQTADPGTYLDVESGVIVTLHETTLLPDEVRVMHFPRRYQRFANRAAALEFWAQRAEARRAA